MRLGLKLRTDFVTNSSSSSFIFGKNTDLNTLEKVVNKKVLELIAQSQACTDKYDKWDLEYTGNALKHVVSHLVTPDKLDLEDLLGVLGWYVYDLCEEICSSKDTSDLCDEDLSMIFTNVLSDLIYCAVDDNKLDADNLEEIAVYELFSHRIDEKFSYVVSNNFEKWIEFVKKYKNEPYKLLEDILYCKYVYYDGDETYYMAVEILSEMEECLYCCGHMG